MEKIIKAAVETADKNKLKVAQLIFLGRHRYEEQNIVVYHFNVKDGGTTLTYIEKE
jgi:hypothetical protein